MSRNDRRNNVHQQGYFESSNQSDMDSSRASGMQGSNRSNDYQSGDFESSRQSHMNNSHIAGERNSNNSQHEMSEGSRQNNLNNNNSQNSNAFDNNAMRNSSRSNTFKSSKSDNTSDGNGSATMQNSFKSNEYHQYELETSKATLADGHQGGNASSIDDLPPEWTALVDPDSGETYYANEQTGETTWDKPEEQNNDSTTSPRSDDHLPADWIALEDAQSGDTYYLNQVTMATTWERPTATDESHPSSTNSGSNNPTPADQLPPGWEAIYDPSCGEYFYAHESGATQWDIPEHNQRDVNDLKSDPQDPDGNVNEKLPLGWYAAVDEDSGDTYYCNEMTGETTWDFPTAMEDNEELKHPHKTEEEEEEEEDVDADLPPEWYSVTDPASGDTYFCNETTGETTWDRPSVKDGKVAHELSMMSRLSMNENTVYESDSMTSSQF